LRTQQGLTQEQLGEKAGIDYKFLGSVERGQQNPSFNVLVKIAQALGVELTEMMRFEQALSDPKQISSRLDDILKTIPVEELARLLAVLRVLYPMK